MPAERIPGAKPRLAFIINSLAGGGAERVFCRVIEGLRDQLHDCEAEIILLDREPSAYTPPSFLPTIVLGAEGGMTASVAKLTTELRRFRPDVAVSFLSRANCATVLASGWCGCRTVISERVATTEHFGAGASAQLKRAVTRELYRRADAIVAVSEGVRSDLVQRCGVPADRIVVIPNPVDVGDLRAKGAQLPDIPLPDRYIVSVNRLAESKNVGLQFEALLQSGAPHDLVILGEGPERGALERRAQALGLGGRVHFLGFVSNPHPIVARADMFLSTSNAEGFPNALAEAMALGVPSVSTNCRSGPAEILADDPDLEIADVHPAPFGILTPVGDAAACAAALQLLSHPEHRARYGRLAAERASAYRPEGVIARYWQVISQFAEPAAPLEAAS